MPCPTPCPPFPANSWTHDYGVQIWWEAGMATHPKNVPGSGLMVGHIRAWGRGVQRMGHEHWATECLRKWSWSNIFWGAGALYVRKLWKMRRSSCQVERLRPFAYLWENTSLDRRYLHWPGISWHSCSGDKCFYSQAASPSQTSHATITLDSTAWSILTDPFYNWQTSLDRNILSTSTRSTENSLSVVTTYFRTLSAKSIVPVWGDQLSWKPDWGAFCFCHHRHDHHHHYLDLHQARKPVWVQIGIIITVLSYKQTLINTKFRTFSQTAEKKWQSPNVSAYLPFSQTCVYLSCAHTQPR